MLFLKALYDFSCRAFCFCTVCSVNNFKVKRFVYLPVEIDEWLIEEAKKDMRTPATMVAKILETIKNEKALSATNTQGFVNVNPNSLI